MCVRARGFGTIYPRGIPANSQGLEFRLTEAGEISCRLEATPLPEYCAFMLAHYDIELGHEIRLQAQASDNADGSFTLRDLTPGTYRLEIDAPGFEVQEKPQVVVVAGATAGPVTVRMRKTK